MPKVIRCRFMTGVRVSCNSEMCMRASRPSKRLAWCRSVSSPLFAVGKLYRMGWGTFWHEGQFVLGLQGDTSTYIPCWFRHNSVVTEGWIRRVHEATPTSPKRAQSSPTSPNGPTVPKPRSPLLRSPGLFPRQCKFAPSQPSWAKCLKG